MNIPVIKAIAKNVASTTLGIASELLDKGAELADEAKEYLDTNDTSKREDRKIRNTSIFGHGEKSHDS